MTETDLLRHVLRHADRALILAQRLLEQLAHAPEIEEDMALANLALDLLGQSRALYAYAGQLEGAGHDEDHFAYWRGPDEFLNPLLVEQPALDFADVVVRQYLHDEYALLFWQATLGGPDATLAALAGKAVKETAYHRRHSRSWVVRLGDGTDESHRRAQAALERLWPYTAELFTPGDAALVEPWRAAVDATLGEATLARPAEGAATAPVGADGHSEGFAELLAELQGLARAHPGATW
jgi:ring-1,2-phenylacetyl-CoA epoxidase subunit PaaC